MSDVNMSDRSRSSGGSRRSSRRQTPRRHEAGSDSARSSTTITSEKDIDKTDSSSGTGSSAKPPKRRRRRVEKGRERFRTGSLKDVKPEPFPGEQSCPVPDNCFDRSSFVLADPYSIQDARVIPGSDDDATVMPAPPGAFSRIALAKAFNAVPNTQQNVMDAPSYPRTNVRTFHRCLYLYAFLI